MKIFFIGDCLSKNIGICDKIQAQANSLNKSYVKTKLYLISDSKSFINEKNFEIELIQVQNDPGLINLLKKHHTIAKKIESLIHNSTSEDIIYIRWIAPYPFYWYVLRKNRNCKVVTEHHSIEVKELKLVSGNFIYIIFLFLNYSFGKLIINNTDGIVGVTEEICQDVIRIGGNPLKPNVTIGNGIEVTKYPLRSVPEFESQIDLLCLAHIQKYHGIDRLIKGLGEYQGPIKVNLHIIGYGDEEKHLKELASYYGIKNEIIFHGFLSGEKLNNLFDICHIAIGSLGMHRKGLSQTSELKGREYTARGIPFILSCSDPDFPSDFPFIYKFSSDESSIPIEKLISFTQMVFSDLDHHKKMRTYAESHLDWSVKTDQLKKFFFSLIDVRNKS